MARYGIPLGAQQAFDRGYPTVTFIKIGIAEDQGGTVRWTDAPVAEEVEFKGEMWNPDNPFLATDDARTFQAEEGIVSVKIADPRKRWFERLRKSPARGLICTINWCVPMVDANPTNPVRFYSYQAFPGRVQSINTTRDDNGQVETAVHSIDKLYYNDRSLGEYTTDSFQRRITTGIDPKTGEPILNSHDNSHIMAHTARKINLLRF